MNLTNFEKTPIFRVFEIVKREAERYGVPVLESEIVGLVPSAALTATAAWYLQLEGFSSGSGAREPAAEESVIEAPTSKDFTVSRDLKGSVDLERSVAPDQGFSGPQVFSFPDLVVLEPQASWSPDLRALGPRTSPFLSSGLPSSSSLLPPLMPRARIFL